MYIFQAFLEFARNHLDLRVLQFGLPASFQPGPVAGQELAQGLSHLESLEKFSTDPRYFKTVLINDPDDQIVYLTR